VPDTPSRIALVTGANRGVGRATALGVARAGFHVVVAARTPRRAAEAATELSSELAEHTGTPSAPPRPDGTSGGGSFSWVAADLSMGDAVAGLAREVTGRHPRIHLLVNNAGIADRAHRVSAEGIERTLAVNHLAPVRLTHHLLPVLLAAGGDGATGARILNVSSGAHAKRLDLTAFEGPKGYAGLHAYSQSKLLNLLHTFDMARRLEGSGVTFNAVHPGLVGTGLLYDFLPEGLVRRMLTPLLRAVSATPERGAHTPVKAATDPELTGVTGRYFRKGIDTEPAAVSREREVQEGVRRWTLGLTGIDWAELPDLDATGSDPDPAPPR
jgi:NAD(P)-dependent dehydrogenase (short-subunit alcohol dehydrogenase family)